MNKDLDNLIANQDQYDNDSKQFLDTLSHSRQDIQSLEEMKRTSGWSLLEKKIREELEQRIMFLVKDDLKITTLLALLQVADTKTLAKALQEEINKIIPE